MARLEVGWRVRSCSNASRPWSRFAGKEGFLVDPDNAVVRAEKQDDVGVVVFGALDDAVAAAKDLQARL
jgi:hypothetical protein